VNPRLQIVAGPLKDSIFALPNGDVQIGRDPSNLLAISDLSLSRRHCVLSQKDGMCEIRDLDSRNGTFVNGVAIKKVELHHADQIAAGESVFVLQLTEEAEEAGRPRVEFDDRMAQATVQIGPQEMLYLQPERVLKELPSGSKVARNLNALVKISRVVHSIRDLDELQAQILALVFEAIPAERGAILLDGNGTGDFESVFAQDRIGGTTKPVHVSRTIARQVLESGKALLGANIDKSGDFAPSDSLIHAQVRSLLCVPLTLFQKVRGCIYLDTSNHAERFDEDHLQLAAAIAGASEVALENARRLRWLQQENLRLSTAINLDHNLVGESPRMKKVYEFLARVAPTDSTVLLQGESGTGKELAARAIHRNSPRSCKPFVAINCAAIPEGLLESELFGHEKGAFTGAIAQKKGRFEIANGGVVFLDEIGELAPALQVKLLRVLQERQFERVGGTPPISVNIRLVAASNRDLAEAVKAGTFRGDLFYRLNVLCLELPALRERREDIAMLAEYFVVKYSKRCKTKPKKISPEATACLVQYDWPGNVRELENAIERALVLTASDTIQPEDLPETILEKSSAGEGGAKYHREVKALKKQLILDALEQTRGNYTQAAQILGVHVNYLHRLIRNLELKQPSVAPGLPARRKA